MTDVLNYARIYKLVNPLGQIYIGSTIQKYLSNRLASHRYVYRNPDNGVSYNSKILFDSCDNIKDVKIYLLENVKTNDKYELHNRERYWIMNTDCVNKLIPNRSPKEYYHDKHAEILERVSKEVKCECGCKVRHDFLTRHKKNAKHENRMKSIDMGLTFSGEPINLKI
tara:strand:- start:1634 stop:2137 length:504 start_codon:yes stop_codon:yes gene_type:complete